MGLFSKGRGRPSKEESEIKDNTSIVMKDEEENESEEIIKKKEEYDEVYDREENTEETNEPEEDDNEDTKEVKWIKKAIELGYDAKKISSLLRKQKFSQEKIEEMIEIVENLSEEELPELDEKEEDNELLEDAGFEIKDANVEDVDTNINNNINMQLNNVLSTIDFRLNKIESYLFRSQNEFGAI